MKAKYFALCAASCLCFGCGSSDEEGGDILPAVSPVNLGKLWPQGANDAEPGSNERVPYEFALLVEAENAAINIEKACLIGNQGVINSNWILESEDPLPSKVNGGEQYAFRLTYERENPGRDAIALVIESDAGNFPQLVVPVCAETVADGQDKSIVTPCEFNEEVPANPCD